MDTAPETPASLTFGIFQVLPHRRELLAQGQPVKLGGRAFDVLMALIEAPGAVVGKEALMQRVWPDRIVDENNLRAQISALRAAFGNDRHLIQSVPGRGYQFTGEIRTGRTPLDERTGVDERTGAVDIPPAPAPTPANLPPTNLPAAFSELIGRDDDLRRVMDFAATHRLATLTGAGGMGKTRIAIAAAHALLPSFADGVWVVELAALSDDMLVPAAVAAAIGLELTGGAVSPEGVAAALGGKNLLLVLDNCEHVVGVAATMAEALVRANPGVHVIATSREPLKAEGEWVYSLPPLAVPSARDEGEDDGQDGGDPLIYGAVRLFFERARAAMPHFSPDRRMFAVIAAICRQLDGIPLAIELAAASAATLGIDELAARLDDRFHLLTGGRRTALPRHQTLRATLDWSYELLAEPERLILRRLAIFAGSFGLEAADVIVTSAEITRSEVVDGLSGLAAKSLVDSNFVVGGGRYRLLESTRTYALEKLSESGERNTVARRHAAYYRTWFERAQAHWNGHSSTESLADGARQIDNIRAALDWAFSPDGDAAIGVALTAAAVPVWIHLSLTAEILGRVERALAALGTGASDDGRYEMMLHTALAASTIYASGPVPALATAWTRALEIAELLNDTDYQLRALWGLWLLYSAENTRVSLEMAQKFCALAAQQADHDEVAIGERMVGSSLYWVGDLPAARRHLEQVLTHFAAPRDRAHIIRYQFDPDVNARTALARILWLQGLPDQAKAIAGRAVDDANAINHAIPMCTALTFGACSVALWTGDLDRAEHYVDMLLDCSARYTLPYWRAYGRSYQALIAIRRGHGDRGLNQLHTVFDELSRAKSVPAYLTILGDIAEGFWLTGQIGDGIAVIARAIERAEQIGDRALSADFLRIRGELMLSRGGSGAATTAESLFRQALVQARHQGALAWELRAATSLARLMRGQDRADDALQMLQPVYERFTEGLDTADLKTAKILIDTLR